VRVLVCGGRHFRDLDLVRETLRRVHAEHRISAVVSGNCRGADQCAEAWAADNFIPVDRHRAEWTVHGKAAGPIRNQQMIDKGKPGLVVAFPGGRGTSDMVRRARAAGVRIIEVSARDRSVASED
jgi:hypothetical protein